MEVIILNDVKIISHNAANQKRYNGTCFDYYLEWELSQFHLK